MLWDKFLYKRASIACYKIIIIANGQKKCGWIRAFPLVIALIPLFFNKCVCVYATTQITVYNSRDIFTIEGNKDVK
jgi:hypothetical protein